MSTSTRSSAMPVAVGMFCAGLVVVLVVFGMSVFGYRDLPWWLNAMTMLCPLGLGAGLVSALARARHGSSLTRN
ncbi:hypothetical protein [Actinopolyspora halophila]|uniref:hypothetical protein n=1 Tax=Actinopolyspora halophila TaxID=1850 RepID=UPI0005279382|nr:hypothetical protein [Actinopolyspora halophila]